MGFFDPKYRYIHNNKNSRDYFTIRGCVRDGSKLLPAWPSLSYRVNTPTNQGVLRSFDAAVKRAKELLRSRPIGTDITLQAVREPENDVVDQVRFRKTLKLPVKDTRGPIGLDRVEGYIEEVFSHARFAGDCVCKPDSDHADCAAVDYFDTDANMIRMRNTILSRPDYFDLKYVILFDRIWFPNGSSQDYTGIYHSHIHVSVTGGTPGAAC